MLRIIGSNRIAIGHRGLETGKTGKRAKKKNAIYNIHLASGSAIIKPEIRCYLYTRVRIHVRTNVNIRILASKVSDLRCGTFRVRSISRTPFLGTLAEFAENSMTRGVSNPYDYRTITYIRTPPYTRERA